MPEKTNEVWLHTGQDIAKGGKVLSLFKVLDQNFIVTDKEQGYILKKALVVGGVYEVEVEREDDKCTLYSNTMKFKEMYSDDEYVEELKLHKAVFLKKQRTKAFEKKHATGYVMPETLNGIADARRKLKSWDDIQAFDAMILNEVRKRQRAMGG